MIVCGARVVRQPASLAMEEQRRKEQLQQAVYDDRVRIAELQAMREQLLRDMARDQVDAISAAAAAVRQPELKSGQRTNRDMSLSERQLSSSVRCQSRPAAGRKHKSGSGRMNMTVLPLLAVQSNTHTTRAKLRGS